MARAIEIGVVRKDSLRGGPLPMRELRRHRRAFNLAHNTGANPFMHNARLAGVVAVERIIPEPESVAEYVDKPVGEVAVRAATQSAEVTPVAPQEVVAERELESAGV